MMGISPRNGTLSSPAVRALAAGIENVFPRPAMAANIITHIFHNAQDGNIYLIDNHEAFCGTSARATSCGVVTDNRAGQRE